MSAHAPLLDRRGREGTSLGHAGHLYYPTTSALRVRAVICWGISGRPEGLRNFHRLYFRIGQIASVKGLANDDTRDPDLP